MLHISARIRAFVEKGEFYALIRGHNFYFHRKISQKHLLGHFRIFSTVPVLVFKMDWHTFEEVAGIVRGYLVYCTPIKHTIDTYVCIGRGKLSSITSIISKKVSWDAVVVVTHPKLSIHSVFRI